MIWTLREKYTHRKIWAHEYQRLILHLQFLQVNEQCWDTDSPKLFYTGVCVCVFVYEGSMLPEGV